MMEIFPGIIVNNKIRSGKPIIKGTRIDVDFLIGKLAGGMTYEEIEKEYELTKDQILTALKYAAASLRQEEVRAIIK